jgi:hypothetical protein
MNRQPVCSFHPLGCEQQGKNRRKTDPPKKRHPERSERPVPSHKRSAIPSRVNRQAFNRCHLPPLPLSKPSNGRDDRTTRRRDATSRSINRPTIPRPTTTFPPTFRNLAARRGRSDARTTKKPLSSLTTARGQTTTFEFRSGGTSALVPKLVRWVCGMYPIDIDTR